MPRNESYLLRLTKPEKDELARRAKEQGISIAKLIRQRLCLDAASFRAEAIQKNPGAVKAIDDRIEFKARVALHAQTKPRAIAERLARKEMREM